jgi:hypothetical protein
MPELITPTKRRRRVRQLQRMLQRVRAILRQKEAAPNTSPIVLNALRSEILALEWVLAEIGEEVPA